jgi:hypothetical protein
MQAEKTQKFVFGIYPGSAVGEEPGLVKGKPDDPKQILDALNKLQGKKIFISGALLSPLYW